MDNRTVCKQRHRLSGVQAHIGPLFTHCWKLL
uniref:Uncharacterized protein n=1 Tax=Mycolicibacterium phage phi1_186018 TaxID=3236641 RepID=A0AB39AKC3_9CAUD